MRLKEVVVARTDKRLAGLLATAVGLLACLLGNGMHGALGF